MGGGGWYFFGGDFCDISIRSSTSARVSYLLLVGMTCLSALFNHPEYASFDICFVSLPVVRLLGPGSADEPFGGFLESKDTCEAFETCILTAFYLFILLFIYLKK